MPTNTHGLLQATKNTNHLVSCIKVIVSIVGLIVPIEILVTTNLTHANNMPQYEIYSSANVMFPVETDHESVFTSDAWLSNSMGKTHCPVP